ncbi:uncharacterized protein LOC144095362 [Amblyomma americanum]
MTLQDGARPVAEPARRVPHAIRSRLKEELDRLEAAGIIAKVREPSDWFVPGKKLVIADTLSRMQGKRLSDNLSDDLEIHAISVLEDRVSKRTMDKLKDATARDPELQQIMANLQASQSLNVSSPYYPKSNGLAEKGVQIIKRLLKKAGSSKEEFWLGLLNYRASPLEDGVSPSKYLMGLDSRTPLPDPCSDSAQQLSKPRKHKQDTNKGQQLPPLQPGDSVRIRSGSKWGTKAIVLDLVAPRSYRIMTEDGSEFRRNRQDLRKTREICNPTSQQLHPTGRSAGDVESRPVLQRATRPQQSLMRVDTPLSSARSTAPARELCTPPRLLRPPTASSPAAGERGSAEFVPLTPPRPAGALGATEPSVSPKQQTGERPVVQPQGGAAETATEHTTSSGPTRVVGAELRRSSRLRRPPRRLAHQN